MPPGGVAARSLEAYAVRVIDAMHDHNPAAIRQHDGKQLI
jgi:hypothetical protein